MKLFSLRVALILLVPSLVPNAHAIPFYSPRFLYTVAMSDQLAAPIVNKFQLTHNEYLGLKKNPRTQLRRDIQCSINAVQEVWDVTLTYGKATADVFPVQNEVAYDWDDNKGLSVAATGPKGSVSLLSRTQYEKLAQGDPRFPPFEKVAVIDVTKFPDGEQPEIDPPTDAFFCTNTQNME